MTNYQEYTVRVCKDYTEYLNKDGKHHRLDGPAVERSDGIKEFWVEGKLLTEQQFKALTSKPKCSGKIVEIDGIKYQLKEVK